MERLFVEAGGRQFEVLQAGGGERLALLLHGFPEHAISWRHQIPALAAMGYRVWAVNQRGYGASARPDRIEDYALPALVGDVAALIDASGASRTVLIGHDWGAMVAWCFAAARTRPIERLVVMNVPHPLCFRAALRRWRQLRRSWYIAFFQLPRLPELTLGARDGRAAAGMFAPLRLPDDVLAIYRRQLADRATLRAMLNWYRAAARPAGRGARERFDLERPIEVPTLVIWGEADVALDVSCLEGTGRYVRDLRIERLPGISHWVQQHAPDEVNRLLRDFLDTGPAGGPPSRPARLGDAPPPGGPGD